MVYNPFEANRRFIYMMRKILLSGREIEYELEFKNVKNINVRVKPGGAIHVSANKRVSPESVDELFRRREAEVLRMLDRFVTYEAERVPVKVEDGSVVYLLGKPLTVKVEKAASNMVTIDGDDLVVYSAGNSIAAIINAWYDHQCRRVLPEYGHLMYERFKNYVSHEPDYSFKKMKSRWGSCNPHKYRMSINRELIKYDERLIEFVFCHEYSHFIHQDHSPSFYNFMAGIMPDHRKRKEELKKAAKIISQM